MNYCELENEKISVKKLFNKYEKFEDRVRRRNMEKEWLNEMLEKDKWKGDFLQEITEKYNAKTILKEENKNYRLVGLPLYIYASENVLIQSFREALYIQI